MRTCGRQDGFTLIELAIVCLVIGILAGIAIPNYARSKAHVNRASCLSNQRHLFEAATLFNADFPMADGVVGSDVLYNAGIVPVGLSECPESRDGSHDDYQITIESGRVTAIRCIPFPADHQWSP